MARLAFFGTPDFAKASLQALIDSDHEVVLVVCQPDKRKGRGKKMQAPPVKELALASGIQVVQPETLKKGTSSGDDFFDLFSTLDLDLGVVVAYGRILATRILTTPKKGFVNVHGSLLPRWRGAAPVQRALEAGDDTTGVCLMDMVFALDAGDVYAARATPIDERETADMLSERISYLGAGLLAEHLNSILGGQLHKTPQPNEGITYATRLEKSEAQIDFARPAFAISCHCRAMYPWPGSETIIDGKRLKLFDIRVCDRDIDDVPGTILDGGDELVIACENGAVAFKTAQVPGKKRMAVADLVRGGLRLTGRCAKS